VKRKGFGEKEESQGGEQHALWQELDKYLCLW
jgi:hypothetical protein